MVLLVGKDHQEVAEKAKKAIEFLNGILGSMGLSLVATKTTACVFGKSYSSGLPEQSIELLGAPISFSSDLKYLGTILSSRKGRLTFEKNVETLVSKCHGIVNRLCSLRPFVVEKENATLLRSRVLNRLVEFRLES
jgi:hypothetical protein